MFGTDPGAPRNVSQEEEKRLDALASKIFEKAKQSPEWVARGSKTGIFKQIAEELGVSEDWDALFQRLLAKWADISKETRENKIFGTVHRPQNNEVFPKKSTLRVPRHPPVKPYTEVEPRYLEKEKPNDTLQKDLFD